MGANDRLADGPAPYDRLREAIHSAVDSGEFGDPTGAVIGWVLLVAQSDLQSRHEDILLVHAPHQSQAMSRGIIDWGRDFVAEAYAVKTIDDEEEDD